MEYDRIINVYLPSVGYDKAKCMGTDGRGNHRHHSFRKGVFLIIGLNLHTLIFIEIDSRMPEYFIGYMSL